eukprot:7607669-Alexandrium_andersonii.AAC.1
MTIAGRASSREPLRVTGQDQPLEGLPAPAPLGRDPDAARGRWQHAAPQGEPQAQRVTASRREPL